MLLDKLASDAEHPQRGMSSRRPRSPSLIHNVKQRPPTIFTSKINGKHHFASQSREAAWARVIGAGSGRVKRKNRPKSGFFQGSVDMAPFPKIGTARLYI